MFRVSTRPHVIGRRDVFKSKVAGRTSQKSAVHIASRRVFVRTLITTTSVHYCSVTCAYHTECEFVSPLRTEC